ncbi:MAG: helix-turn-helix transcriptional regulator [Luteolibacter sp.]
MKGQSLQIWALPSAPTSLKCGDPRDITNREREILHWLREGKSTPEISIIIGCAVRTAEKHIANLYQKLGVKNRAMAILRINGGLEPPMSPAEDTPTLLDHNDLDPGHVRDGRRMSHFIKERLDCGEDASFEKLDPLLLTELLKGRPVSMIANSLGIRSDSVQRRLRAVRDELGVDNNRQLCSMLNLLKV